MVHVPDVLTNTVKVREPPHVCVPAWRDFNRYSWYRHYATDGIGRNKWKVGKIGHS